MSEIENVLQELTIRSKMVLDELLMLHTAFNSEDKRSRAHIMQYETLIARSQGEFTSLDFARGLIIRAIQKNNYYAGSRAEKINNDYQLYHREMISKLNGLS